MNREHLAKNIEANLIWWITRYPCDSKRGGTQITRKRLAEWLKKQHSASIVFET